MALNVFFFHDRQAVIQVTPGSRPAAWNGALTPPPPLAPWVRGEGGTRRKRGHTSSASRRHHILVNKDGEVLSPQANAAQVPWYCVTRRQAPAQVSSDPRCNPNPLTDRRLHPRQPLTRCGLIKSYSPASCVRMAWSSFRYLHRLSRSACLNRESHTDSRVTHALCARSMYEH